MFVDQRPAGPKRKTTIVIDQSLLEDAQRILETSGLSETVHAALREIIRIDAGRRHIEWLKSGNHDLGNPEVMAKAWR